MYHERKRTAARKDQVHIRNAEAARLARTRARQSGKTISEAVLDALRLYRATRAEPAAQGRIDKWRRLLRRDRSGLLHPEAPIESFYNDETGLPE